LLKPVGIEPIHTYHFGEPVAILKKLMNECEYFALGGFATTKSEDKDAWLDSIMPLLVDKGRPTHKLHGFGTTSVEIMDRYPFHSVDSSSWLEIGRFGAAKLTGNLMGRQIIFSEKNLAQNKPGHYTSLSPSDRKAVDEFLLTQDYVTVLGDPTIPLGDRLIWKTGMTARMLAAIYCLTCGKVLDSKRFMRKGSACCADPIMNLDYAQRDILNLRFFLQYERTRQVRKLKIFFAGTMSEAVELAFLQAGVTRRLLSFADDKKITRTYRPMYRQERAAGPLSSNQQPEWIIGQCLANVSAPI
jgi:hypothetical protein